MLDLHCHILPGVDDGAVDLADTLDMARAAVATGCRGVVASSHLWEGLFGTSPELLAAEYPNVVRALEEGEIPLQVVPGAENFYGQLSPEEFAEKAVPIGARGKYVLFDFAMDTWPRDLPAGIDALRACGRTAVIAHPERNRELQADPSPIGDWIARGALVQVNAGSVIGRLGEAAQAAAANLLACGAVHVLASDAHGVGRRRPFCLDRGRDAVAEIVGPEEARRMTSDRPWRIVRGEPVETETVTVAGPEKPRGLWQKLFESWNGPQEEST